MTSDTLTYRSSNTEIREFSRDPFEETEQTQRAIDTTIEYLKKRMTRYGTILDLGRESPLTLRIKKEFLFPCDNTEGDLDVISMPHLRKYDYILYSHTIEHQFNPLHTLLELRLVMTGDTSLFIILPNKPKFLWWKGHYHEIDHYRMKMLLKRAGMYIVGYEKHRLRRNWGFYLKGIRPFLRLFLEWIDYYEVKKYSK